MNAILDGVVNMNDHAS